MTEAQPKDKKQSSPQRWSLDQGLSSWTAEKGGSSQGWSYEDPQPISGQDANAIVPAWTFGTGMQAGAAKQSEKSAGWTFSTGTTESTASEADQGPGLIRSIIQLEVAKKVQDAGGDSLQQDFLNSIEPVAHASGFKGEIELPSNERIRVYIDRLLARHREITALASQVDVRNVATDLVAQLYAGKLDQQYPITSEESALAQTLYLMSATASSSDLARNLHSAIWQRAEDVASLMRDATLGFNYDRAKQLLELASKDEPIAWFVTDIITKEGLFSGKELENMKSVMWGLSFRSLRISSISGTENEVEIPWADLVTDKKAGDWYMEIDDPAYVDTIKSAFWGAGRFVAARYTGLGSGGMIQFESKNRNTNRKIIIRDPREVRQMLVQVADAMRRSVHAIDDMRSHRSEQDASMRTLLRPNVIKTACPDPTIFDRFRSSEAKRDLAAEMKEIERQAREVARRFDNRLRKIAESIVLGSKAPAEEKPKLIAQVQDHHKKERQRELSEFQRAFEIRKKLLEDKRSQADTG